MARRKVLLIGWDAADWKVIRPLMAAGKMPNVQKLVETGATGQISTLHPPLSPMLWTSIATGKRPFKHGIHGFSEPTQDGRGVQPVTNLSRTSKALWNILNQNDLRSIVIGWWPSHPAEPIDGVMVSDQFHRAGRPLDEGWPLAPNAVHPPELAATLADLRVHPDQLTPAMVESFIPLAREIDQDNDKRLGACMRTLAECMSIQSAATWLLDNRPWDFFAAYFDSIDHFCHSFMRYHPPRQSWIDVRDFELYHQVVSRAYQFHDEVLGTLIEKAGQDATVILMSDHGFHPDHLRPASIPDIPAGPAIEHRDFGVFAINGPGMKKGGLLTGTSVLDVAPTVLALFGLPMGEDMDGKVLSQAFAEMPKVEFIPSWEDVPGADGRHPPHTRFDPLAAHEALEQMIALGYVERPDANREIAVTKTRRELRYNLAEAYQDAARHAEAREILGDLHLTDPGEQRFAVRLFVSCQALGMIDEMRRIVARCIPSVGTEYLKAQVLIAEKSYEKALAVLEQVGLFAETGALYMRLHRWSDAGRVYEKTLAMDPDNADAHIGLCKIALHQRRFSDAANSALDALDRVHHYPLAHFLLGRALTGMKEYARAASALHTAIVQNPNFPEAHVRLAGLLEKYLGDPESAHAHRRLARGLKTGGSSEVVPERTIDVPEVPLQSEPPEMPPLSASLIVVTGLPRSGTSMLMQMLNAGGLEILTDGLRPADDDNPRGYLEFQPVKKLLNDSNWLSEARGKAVKIVTPLLAALPAGLPCRVILCERDLDEVLDSQERMLRRRATPDRRRMLKEEYARTMARVKIMLAGRPATSLLAIEHGTAISDPFGIADRVNGFLGGGLDIPKMAAAIEPALHRNRALINQLQ